MADLARFPFDRFLSMRAAGGASFHAGGERLSFITDITGVPQVWAVPAGGGWPDQLTFAQERVNFARFAPHGDHLVFGMDTGGNEQQQLYLLSADGAHVRDLTGQPEALHYWGGWSPDGRHLAFAANRRDPRYFDVYVCDVATGDTRRVYQADAYTLAGPFSPDGRRLLLTRVHGSRDEDLFMLDLAGGDAVHLTPHTGKAVYESPAWAADGQGLYLATDQGRDLVGLAALDLATQALTFLDAPDWDVEAVALAPDGRHLAYTVNVDGRSELRLRDAATGARRPTPPGLPAGGIDVLPVSRDPQAGSPLAWAPDSRRLAVSVSSSTDVPDVWIVAIGGQAYRLTQSSRAGIPPAALGEPALVRYPTFDGRQIPACYYRPPGVAGPLPVVVYVHGGPEAQFRPAFNAVVAYFVNRGYAVFAPNVRGSTGYGRAYTHLDDVERRLDAVADLAAAVDWLVGAGGADRRRIAVMGGSYGGFMVLAAVTRYPDHWAAGVDLVGIANFVTFLERTGPYRRPLRESEYGSLARDRTLLESISPIHQVDRITAPLMVIHGANDPRVPIQEAEQMVAALSARHHPVEYLRFEDEGHGIVKLRNRIAAYTAIGDFLDRYLASGRAAPIPGEGPSGTP